jgi:predicted nucleic acid-binding protein
MPHVALESPEAVAIALNWMASGMDFADALHLATSEHCDDFVTFDRRLGAFARRIGGINVRVL